VIWKGEDFPTFDSCLEAGVKAETALHLGAEYMNAFKSTSKVHAVVRAENDRGKGKVHHNLEEGRCSQGTS
jgi:microcystin degradation protein MlrC